MRFLAIFLIAATPALADPTWHLTAQIYSFHEHTTETVLHNTTPGLGVMRRHSDWLEGAGIFRNSLGRWAGYGYFGWQAPIWRIRAGAIGGLTHNYDANNRGIVPLGAGVVTVPVTQDFAVDVVLIPRVANYTYATANLSLSWRFR